ncbi:MAG: N-acetyltransferase family protein [Casimicrobiaceae bacterium]
MSAPLPPLPGASSPPTPLRATQRPATQLRVATIEDAAAIAAIYAVHVLHGTATFELTPPAVDEMAARMRAIDADGHPWIVAERDASIVGYAYAAPYRARPAYRYTCEDSIYVAPDALGQGIGWRLLDALIEASARRGDRQMIAVIGDARNLASVNVHRAAGFMPIGTLTNVGRKFGRWLDVVMMQRALGDGAGTPPEEGAE